MLQDPAYKSLSPAQEPQLTVPDTRYGSFALAGGDAGAGISLPAPLAPWHPLLSHPPTKPRCSAAPALPGCRTTLETCAWCGRRRAITAQCRPGAPWDRAGAATLASWSSTRTPIGLQGSLGPGPFAGSRQMNWQRPCRHQQGGDGAGSVARQRR